MTDIVEMSGQVLARVEFNWSEGFPIHVSQSIFDGVTLQSQWLDDFSLSL